MKKVLFIAGLLLLVSGIVFSFYDTHYGVEGKGKTVLKFSSWGSESENIVLRKVIADYEAEHENIKIDFLHIPQNYFQKIHLLFASGSEPDIIFVNNQYIKMYSDAGLLENLTPYFENAKNVFFNEAIDCLSDNGNLYAVPRDISNIVIYYNKDILKQHNILNPQINTLEDLGKLCEKLTTPEYFAINCEDNPVLWLTFLAANSGGILSDDAKTLIINSKQSIDALNLYSDFINKYHYAPTKAQIGSMTAAQMFINGKTALYVSGRWMVPKFREVINFDWDVAQFPSGGNKLPVDASGWALAKSSIHKSEAVDFIDYLASEQVSTLFAKSGLIIPARKSVASSDAFINRGNKPFHSSAFLYMPDHAKPTPVNKNYSQIVDIIKEKVQSVLESGVPAQNAFDADTVKKSESLL